MKNPCKEIDTPEPDHLIETPIAIFGWSAQILRFYIEHQFQNHKDARNHGYYWISSPGSARGIDWKNAMILADYTIPNSLLSDFDYINYSIERNKND